MKFKVIIMKIIAILSVLTLIGCSSNLSNDSTDDKTKDEQKNTEKADVLKVALNTVPPTLDPHMTTAKITMEVARPIFESLVVLNSAYEPQPMLAESWQISDDLKTITFNLRKGITFHNGKEMTSEDVVASMNRWKELSSVAHGHLAGATFTAKDENTVELNLEQPNSYALEVLTEQYQFPAIMPKEVVENADPTGVKEYIGTGPYKVDKIEVGKSISYSKFEDYQPLSTPRDGLAGKKEALVDNILMEYVVSPNTRVSGLQTGQYDLVEGVPFDNYELLKKDDKIKSFIPFYGFEFLFFNKKEGVFKDEIARQSVQAALNMEDILISAFSTENFYELDPSLTAKNRENWYNDTGKELYNQNDPEKAKQLLKEAGYNGEEIVLLTSADVPEFYRAALAIEQQLKAIGMNVKLDSYDWPTFVQRRGNPEAWDMFITGFPDNVVPATYVFLHSANSYPGWPNNKEMDRLIEEMRAAESQEKLSALYAELMGEFYKDVPVIKLGNFNEFWGHQDNIKGLDYLQGIIPWNIEKN